MLKNQNKSLNSKKLLILDQAKKIVIKYGWSEKIISKLINNKISSSDLLICFNNDYKEILKFSLIILNKNHESKVKKLNISNFPTGKKIKRILMEKLYILNNDKIFYKKTFYHMILPQNANIMKKNLFISVDNIWYLAGDNSTDFNFYTKRITLTGVYINSLYLLFNKDINEAELSIDKNLKKLSRIPKIKERFLFFRKNIPIFLKGYFN